MNRRKFVKWLMRLPPGVWVAANWSFLPSEPGFKAEAIFMRWSGWDQDGREIWKPLDAPKAQKLMQHFKPYNATGTWEDALAAIDAMAQERPDDNGEALV